LGRHLVRGDDVDARMPPAQLRRHGALVRGVAEREEQADRDRLRVADVRNRAEIERLQLAVRAETPTHAEAALERDERLRVRLAESIQVCARLAAQVEQVLEAGVADVGGAGAAPL